MEQPGEGSGYGFGSRLKGSDSSDALPKVISGYDYTLSPAVYPVENAIVRLNPPV